jgi:hypothetical protein
MTATTTRPTQADQYDYTRPGRYPRSGRVTLGGVVYLARAIDKMRADLNGTVGEYIAACPQSRRVYDLFGVTPEEFRAAVRKHPDDEGVLHELEQIGRQPSPEEVREFNDQMLSARAAGEMRQRLYQNLVAAGRGDRRDVSTFVDFQDVEEGRRVPRRDEPSRERAAA